MLFFIAPFVTHYLVAMLFEESVLGFIGRILPSCLLIPIVTEQHSHLVSTLAFF
jgi:hypothetical protein